MTVYKPLPGLTRLQKHLPWLVALTSVTIVINLVSLTLAIGDAASEISLETLDAFDYVDLAGIALSLSVGLWFLIDAILDTLDHDHEFQTPVWLGFLACCVPPLHLALPYALLAQVLGRTSAITQDDHLRARILVWIWGGLLFLAHATLILVGFELIESDEDRAPVSTIVESVLWTSGSLASLFAILAVTAAVAQARKLVIRDAAARLAQSQDPNAPVGAQYWDPNDPFRPRF